MCILSASYLCCLFLLRSSFVNSLNHFSYKQDAFNADIKPRFMLNVRYTAISPEHDILTAADRRSDP